MADHEDDPREHVDDAEQAAAWDPAVGGGTPDTAPHEQPPLTLLERQPIRIVGAAQAIVAAATTAALDVPVWAGLLLGAGLYTVEEYKRLKVTPSARPRDNAGHPLTP
jgi:hypothetical protein